jgi:hypothetical protein
MISGCRNGDFTDIFGMTNYRVVSIKISDRVGHYFCDGGGDEGEITGLYIISCVFVLVGVREKRYLCIFLKKSCICSYHKGKDTYVFFFQNLAFVHHCRKGKEVSPSDG